jgi:hypothetical protein
LIALEPMLAPKPLPGFGARTPLLLSLAQDDALLLVQSYALESPGPVPSRVDAFHFSPWGSWPPAISEPLLVHGAADVTPFVASVEPKGSFALGVQRFPMNAPPGCVIDELFQLDPVMPPGPSAFQLPINGTCDDRPIAVGSSGDGHHLYANDLSLGGGAMVQRGLVMHVTDASGGSLYFPPPRCASTPLVGDFLPGEEDFLVLHSTATEDECFPPGGPKTGVANRLLLRRMSASGEQSGELHQGVDALVFARLLPRAQGAWAFFRESGASAFVQPALVAMPLSAGDVPGAPFAVTPEGVQDVAVASLGEGFAVAHVDAIDPSAPTVVLRAFSGEGALLAETSFSTNEAWLSFDRLALVGSKDGTRLLVGWIGSMPGQGTHAFLRAFECAVGD